MVADAKDPISRPSSWDKAVSAAYLRIQGQSQGEAAKNAGVGERTLARWERCSWWLRAKAEASDRWLAGLKDLTRGALVKALEKGDVETARWAADRLIPELAPPRVRTSSSVFQWNLDELSEEELELIKDAEDEEQATKLLLAHRRRQKQPDEGAAE